MVPEGPDSPLKPGRRREREREGEMRGREERERGERSEERRIQ